MILHVDNHDIYRDDWLIMAPENKRTNDVIMKKLFEFFKSLNLEIDVEMNMQIVQFLETEFNLLEGRVSRHMKPNLMLKNVNTKSNHSNSVIKQILKRTEC